MDSQQTPSYLLLQKITGSLECRFEPFDKNEVIYEKNSQVDKKK